jgi:hypothetical protein
MGLETRLCLEHLVCFFLSLFFYFTNFYLLIDYMYGYPIPPSHHDPSTEPLSTITMATRRHTAQTMASNSSTTEVRDVTCREPLVGFFFFFPDVFY